MWRLAPLGLTFAALLACGARTSLEAGAGGAVGRPGPATSGVGGTGGGVVTTGAGGAGNAPCTLEPLAVVRSFDTQADHFGHAPRLAATRSDGTQATLVVRADPDPFPIDGNSIVTQVTFEPWGDWPATVLGVERQLLVGGLDFAIPKTAEDGLTLWGSYATQASPPGMFLLREAATDVDDPAGTIVYGFAARTSFVTGSHVGSYGLGFVTNAGAEQGKLAVFTANGGTPQVEVACTTARFWHDGMRGPNGDFTAAVATPELAGCNVGRELEIVHFDESATPVVVHARDLEAPIVQLQVVPHGSDEAWVVWQVDGGITIGPIVGMRIDASGNPLGDPVVLIGDGTVFNPVATTMLGDDLVVAYVDAIDPSAPQIVLARFDDAGTPGASIAYTPPAWLDVADRYTLLAAPTGDQLLLSWAAIMPDPSVAGGARVYVARFDCR